MRIFGSNAPVRVNTASAPRRDWDFSVAGEQEPKQIQPAAALRTVDVLASTLALGALMWLRSATADLRDSSGDAKLDAMLAGIEPRLAVEIAKMTPR